jgi:hypothetical protein
VWWFLSRSHLPRASTAARTSCRGVESGNEYRLCIFLFMIWTGANCPTHSHKITQTNMSGSRCPRSMTYSFTSVGNCLHTSGEGSLITWKI